MCRFSFALVTRLLTRLLTRLPYYKLGYERTGQALPNASHYACAALDRIKPTAIITQNVDGLHERVG